MTGYKENFIDGILLPIPSFSTELSSEVHEQGKIYHYPTYSLVMNNNANKRSPVIVCLNADQNKFHKTKRSDRWRIDSRIGYDNQLDNEYYSNNPWDRGHMARRTTAAWGNSLRDSQYAADETFFYSNSCLQHANLNQDEWLALEDWVFHLDLAKDGKISSFSGPFYGDYDRSITPSGRRTALVPAGFFKVVCFKNMQTNELDIRAFVIYQDIEALKDKGGSKKYSNQHYQVTITQIEELTGLRFDNQVYEANPLYYSEGNNRDGENVKNFPEAIEVAKAEDMICKGQLRQTINDDLVDIFIAAAMINPEGDDAGNEWISLINLGAEVVDINGWFLTDNSELKHKIGSIVLAPGQSTVIKGLKPLKLANSGDIIKLFDSSGARIDWVNYTDKMVKTGKPVLFLNPRDTLMN